MSRAAFGLGNPGLPYERTRHNLGFLAIDTYLQRHGRGIRPIQWPEALIYRLSDRLLVKPLTYMNLSGQAVRQACQEYQLAPSDCLIVYDDYALPWGRLRARRRGGDGGHHGMLSIIETLGTREIPRLRLGIGSSEPRADLIEYVLSPFTSDEEQQLPTLLARAAEAIDLFFREGIEAVMQTFNAES
jgi:PTH1 family peptidyl-tRNA hydrolase